MRVLGVDPGLSRCGIGVVDGPAGRPRVVRAGVVRTPHGTPTAQRLVRVFEEVGSLISDCRPDAVAVERVFFNTNVSTAIGVSQAAGVVLLAAAQARLPVVEYTPSEVKAAVAGNGAAEKEQVGYMVRALLRLADVPRPADVADALALALCHLQAQAGGGAGDQRGGAAAGAGLSPRLAAAIEAAGPGAQVVRRP